MLLKGIIISLSIAVFGLIALMSLFLLIKNWKNKRTKIFWTGCFTVSVVLTGLISIYSTIAVFEKTVAESKEIKSVVVKSALNGLKETLTDNREMDEANAQIRLLKGYVPLSLKDDVNANFYTYFGFRDNYRCPLVYPFAIHCIDDLANGDVYDERMVTDFSKGKSGARITPLTGLKEFTFDQNLLIGRVSSEFENDTNLFVIFHFKTKEIERHSTKTKSIQKARKIGYKGPEIFLTINEYNTLF